MRCTDCRYNTLCWAGKLFNTHVTVWCPECGRLQVCERILEPGVREFKRASPSDPHTVYVGLPDSFQKGVKPFREVRMIFECEQRTHASVIMYDKKSGLNVNPGSFGRTEYVEDPGPPQHNEWSDAIQREVPNGPGKLGRSLEIKKCVVCNGYRGYKRLPVSVRMLDTEQPAYVCESIPAEKGSK